MNYICTWCGTPLPATHNLCGFPLVVCSGACREKLAEALSAQEPTEAELDAASEELRTESAP